MSQSESEQTTGKESPAVLRAISVAGYKSIGDRQRIEIRPLTLLAGANSGGKSSLIQPMLLLKQTLEAPYDPGSLLLDGPNVRLTSVDQLLSKLPKSKYAEAFLVGFELDEIVTELYFQKASEVGLEISRSKISRLGKPDIVLEPMIGSEETKKILASLGFSDPLLSQHNFFVVRDRSFLTVAFSVGTAAFKFPFMEIAFGSNGADLPAILKGLIHLPGLRGNPQRTYKTTAVNDVFVGTFENYVASLIYHWQKMGDQKLDVLARQLEFLGLGWKVSAKRLDDTQVELKVSRLPPSAQSGADDLVSIADVGFGVSQTLPVLVALLVAKPGQVVYLEQPEIHLHPRAQLAMAKILAEAAQRGVIVIAETHSALLLQGIQTLVAKDELDKDLIKLHWVQRDETGMTKVNSADLDETGAFGNWPVDFMEVGLEADNEYLSAAEAKLSRQAP